MSLDEPAMAKARYQAALKLYAEEISKASGAYVRALETAADMRDPVRAAEVKDNARRLWERTTELLSSTLHAAMEEYVQSIRGERSDGV